MSKEQEDLWLKVAKYNEMSLGDSEILVHLGDEKYVIHREGENIDVGNVNVGVVVTKNLMGPQFGVITKASLGGVNNYRSRYDYGSFPR